MTLKTGPKYPYKDKGRLSSAAAPGECAIFSIIYIMRISLPGRVPGFPALH